MLPFKVAHTANRDNNQIPVTNGIDSESQQANDHQPPLTGSIKHSNSFNIVSKAQSTILTMILIGGTSNFKVADGDDVPGMSKILVVSGRVRAFSGGEEWCTLKVLCIKAGWGRRFGGVAGGTWEMVVKVLSDLFLCGRVSLAEKEKDG